MCQGMLWQMMFADMPYTYIYICVYEDMKTNKITNKEFINDAEKLVKEDVSKASPPSEALALASASNDLTVREFIDTFLRVSLAESLSSMLSSSSTVSWMFSK